MGAKTKRPHVVVVGAGFGGLRAVKALAAAKVDITLVDARNHHTFQPLLYQVATAGLDVDEVCAAVRGIVSSQDNARAIQARMTSLDTARQVIELDTGQSLEFDHLVLALGAVTADFGVPGVAEHAFGLKSAADARQLRNHVLTCFEQAEADERARQRLTTVVLVGGGPTGVEMAGGLAELFDRVLRKDFRGLNIDEARVVLVEGSPDLLTAFDKSLRAKALNRLERFGVDVRLNTTVAGVGPSSVTFTDGTSVDAATVVWAAGVRANPLAAVLGFETGRGGRIVVDDQLRVPGHDNIYAIGDLAIDPDDALPQVAAVAVQGGDHVARCIRAAVDGSAVPKPFSYNDKGSMATIGRNSAVVELPNGLKLSGFAGWVAWLGLHLIMLIGFRNRANVLVNWAWNYLTYDRGSRVIVDVNDEAARRSV